MVELSAPRASVICIFYNAERFLAEAVASVLGQAFHDFELLLVDDGSTDGSTRLALDFVARENLRIRYLEHDGHANRGRSASRNLGLRHARGEFITYIDADDVWPPDKLGQQVSLLDAHPEVSLASGAILYWESWAGGHDRLTQVGHVRKRAIAPPEAVLALYPLGTCPAIATDAMVRRSTAEAVGGFANEFTGLYDEQVFFVKIMLRATVYFSDQTWLFYRRHADSCVHIAHRDHSYAMHRAKFLDWLENYLATCGFDVPKAVDRAVKREQWLLRHPLIARMVRRLWKRRC